jgi:hypothetical protein
MTATKIKIKVLITNKIASDARDEDIHIPRLCRNSEKCDADFASHSRDAERIKFFIFSDDAATKEASASQSPLTMQRGKTHQLFNLLRRYMLRTTERGGNWMKIATMPEDQSCVN